MLRIDIANLKGVSSVEFASYQEVWLSPALYISGKIFGEFL